MKYNSGRFEMTLINIAINTKAIKAINAIFFDFIIGMDLDMSFTFVLV